LGWYIPLSRLAEDFYFSQHEIGYLEAAALIEFMVETWGWPAYSAFYRDIHPLQGSTVQPGQQGGSQSAAIEAALNRHFGLGLAQLEERFQEALQRQTLTPGSVEDVRLTVKFYDTVRRYQQLLDPSAYFMTAWLPDLSQMRSQGIVADLLRHPSQPENVAVETLLMGADASLQAGDYARLEKQLAAVNALLDAYDGGVPAP
jgi:hypothetical protein